LEKICEICTPAEEPVLRAVKSGVDVVLTWDEPSVTPWYWHLYWDENPDPALCGPPLNFYRATALNDCGETPLD
jgi:hypothetical protein